MKVKVTATLTLETEIFPQDYPEVDGGEDAIIAFELQQIGEEPWNSSLAEQLFHDGSVSNVKIETTEDDEAEAA